MRNAQPLEVTPPRAPEESASPDHGAAGVSAPPTASRRSRAVTARIVAHTAPVRARLTAAEARVERTRTGGLLIDAGRRYRRMRGGLLASSLGLRLVMMLVPIVLLMGILASDTLYGKPNGLTTPTEDLIRGITGNLNHLAIWADVLAVVGSFWAGSEFFAGLEETTARIYDMGPRRYVRQRLLAFVLLGSFVATILLVATASLGIEHIPGVLARIVGTTLAILIVGCFLFGIYRLLPPVAVRARDVLPGVAIAAVGIVILTISWPVYVAVGTSDALVSHEIFFFTTVLTLYVFLLSILIVFSTAVNAELYTRRRGAQEGPSVSNPVATPPSAAARLV